QGRLRNGNVGRKDCHLQVSQLVLGGKRLDAHFRCLKQVSVVVLGEFDRDSLRLALFQGGQDVLPLASAFARARAKPTQRQRRGARSSDQFRRLGGKVLHAQPAFLRQQLPRLKFTHYIGGKFAGIGPSYHLLVARGDQQAAAGCICIEVANVA